MWFYRRRLSIHPVESNVTFAGQRLHVAADGRVLTPVNEDLDLKMRRAPHIFIFKADAPAPVEAEKIETSSSKDDNVKASRPRRRRKAVKSEG
jgi:hypothetical protein